MAQHADTQESVSARYVGRPLCRDGKPSTGWSVATPKARWGE